MDHKICWIHRIPFTCSRLSRNTYILLKPWLLILNSSLAHLTCARRFLQRIYRMCILQRKCDRARCSMNSLELSHHRSERKICEILPLQARCAFRPTSLPGSLFFPFPKARAARHARERDGQKQRPWGLGWVSLISSPKFKATNSGSAIIIKKWNTAKDIWAWDQLEIVFTRAIPIFQFSWDVVHCKYQNTKDTVVYFLYCCQ